MSNNWNDPNAPQGGNSWDNQGADQGWNQQSNDWNNASASQPSANSYPQDPAASQGWDSTQNAGGQGYQTDPAAPQYGEQQSWDANAGQNQSWDTNANAQQGWDANQNQGWDANQNQGWDTNQQSWNGGAAYGAGAPIAPGANIGPGGLPLANWGKRALGALIDIVIPTIIIGSIGAWITDGPNTNTTDGGFRTTTDGSDLLTSLITWALIGLLMGALAQGTGLTPGRKVAKTQLVTETGTPPTFVQIFLRSLLHVIDTYLCCIGFLWPLWDKKRQTLADKIMKTYVVDTTATGPINVQR